MALTQAINPMTFVLVGKMRMMGGLFVNASVASPPAVYFAKSPPIIRA
jgi:hypothetical protein